MDPLAAFLDGPRAQGAFVLRAVLDAPWSIRVQDEAALTVVVVMRGEGWFEPATDHPSAVAGRHPDADTAPRRLVAGDVAIVRGPGPYLLSDHPGAEPTVAVHPGGRCQTLSGTPLDQTMALGVRTWGNSADGETVLLIGTYQTDGEVSRLLLDSLPLLVVLGADAWETPFVGILADEVVREAPGQQAVLDRLLDLLLIAALREAFASELVSVPEWFSADADPVVGPAIRLLQSEPARAWTVADLAAEVGVSRALLARRFNQLVGEPPMTFLTGRRMALAADLMVEPDATVTSVARRVGYGSPFTFSAAFKRVHGISPRGHRERAASLHAAVTSPPGVG